jgi:uncharacterized membrane protein YfcA
VLLVLLAGLAAGTINTIVGSGTLITFPALLAVGLPPVVANISNTIGILFGSVSGVWGYRRELAGQARRLRLLAPVSLIGGGVGALALLVAPESTFELVVPVLVGVAVVLVIVQPRLATVVAQRRARQAEAARAGLVGADAGGVSARPGQAPAQASGGAVTALVVGTGLTGVYGGYFGAAQGVILVGLLGSLLPESLQRVNAVKNVLALIVNVVAALVFTTAATDRVDWAAAGLVAVGSLVGGLLGARIGRRLAPRVLRAVIVVVGVAALVRLTVGG